MPEVNLIIQAVLAAIQLAAQALPVIQQYEQIWGAGTGAHIASAITTPLNAGAAQGLVHPVTAATAAAILAPAKS